MNIVNAGQFRLGSILMSMLVVGAVMAADEDMRGFSDEGRRLANLITSQVRSELVKELERTGPIRAIVVCKYSVPEITSTLSRQSGMRVTRVALRPRNPALAEPDAWEQRVLLDFEKRVAKGERADMLEFAELVQEPAGKAMRYMKAIAMAQPCLHCHGPGAQIADGVRAQLAAEYPNDRAIEYQVGQIRGAISVKKTTKD